CFRGRCWRSELSGMVGLLDGWKWEFEPPDVGCYDEDNAPDHFMADFIGEHLRPGWRRHEMRSRCRVCAGRRTGIKAGCLYSGGKSPCALDYLGAWRRMAIGFKKGDAADEVGGRGLCGGKCRLSPFDGSKV